MPQWILLWALLVSQFVMATNVARAYDFIPETTVAAPIQGERAGSGVDEDGKLLDRPITTVDLCLPPMAVVSPSAFAVPVLRDRPPEAYSFSVVVFIPHPGTPPPIRT